MPPVTETMERVRARALEIGVFLPLGAYATVRDELAAMDPPTVGKLYAELVARGQQRLEPIDRAVRRRVGRIERRAGESADAATRSAATGARRAEAAVDAVAPRSRVAAPRSADKLPIARYDELTADEIRTRVRGLTQTDLARVYKYEKAHQNRATVLDAVESHFVDLPIATYDALTVDEIVQRLGDLNADELQTLRDYEANTKARTTLLDRIDTALRRS
ncbi:MAG TPA: hypothetical protein VHJ34_03200 [Actinomycetota bacterium]|nr:hypothetical protein [Actinomycetota bacterium]